MTNLNITNWQIPMQNINPETNIPYGYISAHELHDFVVHELMYGENAVDHSWREAFTDAAQNLGFEGTDYEEAEDWAQTEDKYIEVEDLLGESDCEPLIDGTYEGVMYQTSWLGGALNFWIFNSPVITKRGTQGSPCVPNACVLDNLDGDYEGYDVPDEWRCNQNYADNQD